MPFALVDLSGAMISALKDNSAMPMEASYGSDVPRSPAVKLGIGDIVQLTIFESQAGGLFIPAAASSSTGNYVTLPQQTVDQSGRIAVPYAGSVRVAGRSAAEVQHDIERRLAVKAIEPQVVLSLVSRRGAQVSVLGDVASAGTFPIDAGGSRILDMLSKAAGIKSTGYETEVTLQRVDRTATIAFDELVQTPAENVYVMPGDVIYVARRAISFLAFGASGENGKYDFGAKQISLAEAIALAKGLSDGRADPRQVFIYRMEDRRRLNQAGIDLSALPPQSSTVPVIYRANLREPDGYFLAQGFPMRDKDVVYISNASAVELAKFLSLLQTASSIGANARIAAQ